MSTIKAVYKGKQVTIVKADMEQRGRRIRVDYLENGTRILPIHWRLGWIKLSDNSIPEFFKYHYFTVYPLISELVYNDNPLLKLMSKE